MLAPEWQRALEGTTIPEVSATSPAEQRDALRRDMRSHLAKIDPAELTERSRRAAAKLIEGGFLDRAQTLLLFAPLLRTDGSREIETLPIAEEAWRRGLTVCLPRVDWAERRLAPVVVRNYDADLIMGRYGVLEPRPGLPEIAPPELNVVVTPGLAFDRRGHRLGHGVGFYDRFLAPSDGPGDRPPPSRRVRGLRIGMALAAQIVETLPSAPHDVPMQVVVTEDEVFLPSTARDPG